MFSTCHLSTAHDVNHWSSFPEFEREPDHTLVPGGSQESQERLRQRLGLFLRDKVARIGDDHGLYV